MKILKSKLPSILLVLFCFGRGINSFSQSSLFSFE